MAHTLINGDSTMNAPRGMCIWEVAQELEMEIADFATKLDEIASIIGKLGELAPNEEYEDESDESDL